MLEFIGVCTVIYVVCAVFRFLCFFYMLEKLEVVVIKSVDIHRVKFFGFVFTCYKEDGVWKCLKDTGTPVTENLRRSLGLKND